MPSDAIWTCGPAMWVPDGTVSPVVLLTSPAAKRFGAIHACCHPLKTEVLALTPTLLPPLQWCPHQSVWAEKGATTVPPLLIPVAPILFSIAMNGALPGLEAKYEAPR